MCAPVDRKSALFGGGDAFVDVDRRVADPSDAREPWVRSAAGRLVLLVTGDFTVRSLHHGAGAHAVDRVEGAICDVARLGCVEDDAFCLVDDVFYRLATAMGGSAPQTPEHSLRSAFLGSPHVGQARPPPQGGELLGDLVRTVAGAHAREELPETPDTRACARESLASRARASASSPSRSAPSGCPAVSSANARASAA